MHNRFKKNYLKIGGWVGGGGGGGRKVVDTKDDLLLFSKQPIESDCTVSTV